ncbi:hypothetical protein [Nesterenkonia ebinurensis]|uniref:hypothetical protein n=1 Tax=Nesterenkonia ebinurensis TaxID=2608252 RepID=UPI00123D6E63|nr:hypothetical protein [Nesterenkonia ebinurensis]
MIARTSTTATLSLVALLALTACDGDNAESGAAPDNGAEDTTTEESADDEEQTSVASEADDADEDDPEEDGDVPQGESLPNTPQAYTAITIVGDESALPEGEDGEVSVVAISEPDGNTSFPFIVHNRTGQTVSRVEVSGRALGPEGETLGTGSSHSVDPNVIPPGGYGFGYVYVDSSDWDLPAGSEIPDLRVKYTEGLGSFENIITLDIDNFEQLPSGDLTGDVVNPHDVTVTGPISVDIVCLSDGGRVTDDRSFTDSDEVDPGDYTTWTISSYGGSSECVVRLLSASGYDMW